MLGAAIYQRDSDITQDARHTGTVRAVDANAFQGAADDAIGKQPVERTAKMTPANINLVPRPPDIVVGQLQGIPGDDWTLPEHGCGP